MGSFLSEHALPYKSYQLGDILTKLNTFIWFSGKLKHKGVSV